MQDVLAAHESQHPPGSQGLQADGTVVISARHALHALEVRLRGGRRHQRAALQKRAREGRAGVAMAEKMQTKTNFLDLPHTPIVKPRDLPVWGEHGQRGRRVLGSPGLTPREYEHWGRIVEAERLARRRAGEGE